MSYKIGLTGSIGMGKSTAAGMFKDIGVPVWDADQAVHELYSTDQSVIDGIAAIIPGVKSSKGLDRSVMRDAIAADTGLLKKIEAIVHPAVAKHREDFLSDHANYDVVVLEIPLLFELGLENAFDAAVVVSTDAKTQRERVLSRGTMSEKDFEIILAKQVPDSEKRIRASHIIPSDTLDGMYAAIEELLEEIKKSLKE